MDIIFIGLFIIFVGCCLLWIFKIFKEEQDKSIKELNKELRKQSEDMKENPEKYGF